MSLMVSPPPLDLGPLALGAWSAGVVFVLLMVLISDAIRAGKRR